MKEKDLTPLYFRYTIHLIRPFPNFDPSFIKPVRQKAVELLRLKKGDRVLDMGCGPGGSFPYLVHSVGPSGEVVGVEISPEVTINARRRVERNKWKNVQVIEADARTVHLTGTFDGLLMFATDAIVLEEALENIFPHLRENARVALFGAKVSTHRLGRMLNPFFRMMISKLSFPTTPWQLDSEPWRMVAKYVEGLDVEEYFFGSMFLASGTMVTKKGKQKIQF